MLMLVFVFLVGLCLGSFINAFVWRLRHKRDWVKERSECGHCGHVLAAKDLIPIISWLQLRGKCRYCHKPIEDSPLTEVLTGLLFLFSYAVWPRPLTTIAVIGLVSWLLLLVVLISLALYDLKYMLLPNKLVLAAGLIVGFYTVAMTISEGPDYLLDTMIGLLAFGGLFYLLFQISKGKWIGGGDVKLGFVLGAWLADARLSLLAIFVASLVGTLYAIVLVMLKKTTLKAKLPFGPLLIIGTLAMTLYGQGLLDGYTNLLIGY